jgi:hypothetical protein
MLCCGSTNWHDEKKPKSQKMTIQNYITEKLTQPPINSQSFIAKLKPK